MRRFTVTYCQNTTSQVTIFQLSKVQLLKALEGDSKYEDIVMELMNTVDEYIPEPERDTDKPLLLPVEDVFSITGRGTVASGRRPWYR